MEKAIPRAKADVETLGDGGFIAKAFVRLPNGNLETLLMPWRDMDEKVAMSAALRIMVRKTQAVAFVVVSDAYVAGVAPGELEEYRRQYRGASEHPDRIEALMFYLWWQGGSDLLYLPYDRDGERIIWRAEPVRSGEGGRVTESRFNPGYGLD